MQRDFFDDEQRDVVNPGDHAQGAAKAEPIRAQVIDAEVVEEVEGARAHQAASDSESNKHEKLTLIVFVAVLLGGVLMLQSQTKALQSANFAEAPSMNVPVVVRYHTAEQPKLSQDQAIKVTFSEIVDNAEKLKKSAAKLSRPDVPESKVLTEQDYIALKQYLAQKEGIENDEDVRDILLQAGYKLPARLPDEEKANKRTNRDHMEFARHVIKSLLKDEVEDFLQKVQIVSEVGVYVADTAQEE